MQGHKEQMTTSQTARLSALFFAFQSSQTYVLEPQCLHDRKKSHLFKLYITCLCLQSQRLPKHGAKLNLGASIKHF